MVQEAMPLVSVIVPVYNVERFVHEALSSIAMQTYENLQIIVIDDCSTDGTRSIVEEFLAKDKRFILLKNEKNLKIVETLNKGLKVATGNFIARCDGDDVMEPDRISKQLEYLFCNPGVALVGCSMYLMNENGVLLRNRLFPNGPRLIQKLLPYSAGVSHIWLARRQVYDVVGPYRIPTVEDYDFLLRADRHGFKLDNVPLYYGMRIRTRNDNTVGRYGIVQRKLFNYAKAVNSSERKGKINSYSEADVNKIIASGRRGLLARAHYYSDRLSYLASLCNDKLRRILLILAAAVVSPYKFQYYFRAAVASLILWKHKNGWLK